MAACWLAAASSEPLKATEFGELMLGDWPSDRELRWLARGLVKPILGHPAFLTPARTSRRGRNQIDTGDALSSI